MAEASTSPSTRFIPISTHHLASEPASSETTLRALLDRSEQLADEAKEALPYSFDECTYTKGYLRQSVWSCLDCGEKGVCYGCSISCHAEHKLVELWTRRHFRCDCPTTSIPTGPGGKRRKCTLNPPEAQPQEPNEENRYSKNFGGKFCRCGREYDPETETEAMLNCIGCEDWLHESCLNLLAPKPDVVSGTVIKKGGERDEEEDDEEREVIIPSERYDGLVCASCVGGSTFLQDNAGQKGWMIIEPDEVGVMRVRGGVGRTAQLNKEVKDGEEQSIKAEETADTTKATGTGDKAEGDEQEQVSLKRSADEEVSDGTASKRQRLGGSGDITGTAEQTWTARKGKGDIFLAHGIRAGLKESLPDGVARSLPFPLVDEEIYEPPQDEDEDETLEQVTERVVGALPRVQAIEALHGYQNMKDKLKDMLAGHATEGRAVSKEDIEGFFEQLRSARSRA